MERGDGQHDNLLAFQAFLDSSPEAREPVVEITAFRRLCAKGIPDHPKHLRPLAYSLLLEILPANKREWRSQLRRRRREYHELVQRYMTELEAMDLPSSPLDQRDKLLRSTAVEVEQLIPRFTYLKGHTIVSSASPLRPSSSDGSGMGSYSLTRSVSSSASSEDGDGKGPQKSAKGARNRQVTRLPCCGAATMRLRMIAEMEYRRQSTSQPLSSSTSNEASSDSHPDLLISSPALSPRITLSSDNSAPMLSRLEGKRPLPLKIPQSTILPNTPQSANASGSSSSIAPLSPITLLSPQPIPAPGSAPSSSLPDQLLQPDTHGEALLRLLYIFRRSHPEANVPGLADVLVNLYSVYLEIGPIQFSRTSRRIQSEIVPATGLWVEEQTFVALTALTTWFHRLIFDPIATVPDVPKDDLITSLSRLDERLRWADEQVWTILQDRGLSPSTPLYAYRWFATLFAQDFPPQAVLRLWDFMLAESTANPMQDQAEPLIDIGVAIIICCKRLLMGYITPPNPNARRGLWADTDNSPVPIEHDVSRDLEILRSPPLAEIGGIQAILETTLQVRNARLVGEMEDGSETGSPYKWAATIGRVADGDGAAKLAKASSNITASMISTWTAAARAISHARIPSDSLSSATSSSILFSTEVVEGSRYSGETYTSLPSTPRRNNKFLHSPPLGPSPLIGGSRHVHNDSMIGDVAPSRRRPESLTSNGSMSSLRERLAALTHSVAPVDIASHGTVSGPKPLLLSRSATTRISGPDESRFASPRRSASSSPSPIKQGQPVPHPPVAEIGRGFPSAFHESAMNGQSRVLSGTLSPPFGDGPEPSHTGLYRTTSNSSVGLYRVISGEREDSMKLTDVEARARGEEGGLYQINARSRSPISRSRTPGIDESSFSVKGPRGPRPSGVRTAEAGVGSRVVSAGLEADPEHKV